MNDKFCKPNWGYISGRTMEVMATRPYELNLGDASKNYNFAKHFSLRFRVGFYSDQKKAGSKPMKAMQKLSDSEGRPGDHGLQYMCMCDGALSS
jgi:hypothetical protein